MVSIHEPLHLSSGVAPHATPVLRGCEVPTGPVVASTPLARKVACGACDALVPAASFCCACGERLQPLRCGCGTDLPPDACFCASCGSRV